MKGSGSASTSSTEPLLEVGRIAKPHGLRGEVIVELTTNREERVAPGSTLFTAGGPLVVSASSSHHGRWIVSFAGVADRDGADALRGVVLMAAPLTDPSELWVHELIGSSVFDVGGMSHGRVVSVIANPASDLLELEGGELVPARFVTRFAAGRVDVDVPEGLFS